MIRRAADAVISGINRLLSEKPRVIIAVDGRCASGKTTLCDMLSKSIDCCVFHMDDFFLRPCQRTKERYEEPGGNVDRERFLEEVLLPLEKGGEFYYRPYDCHSASLCEKVYAKPCAVNIIEGTYSCHPYLAAHYDLRVFLTVSEAEQLKRIEKRNADSLRMFIDRWIPLEEKYFAAFDIEKQCDMRFEA